MALVSALYRGCGCAGLIGIALLIGGSQALYIAVTNRSPLKMSCADYLTKMPEGKWLQLSNCQVFRGETISKSFLGKGPISEVYIPVRPVDAESSGKIKLLLYSRDKDDLAIAQQMRDAGDDVKKLTEFMIKSAGKLVETREIEGTLKFGIDMSDKDRQKLTNAEIRLDPGFVVLQAGERPNLAKSCLLVGGGILLSLFALIRKAGSRPAKQAQVASA